MLLYDILRYSHGIFFVGLQTALMFGFFLEWIRDRRAVKLSEKTMTDNTPKVSVIIPIHNESKRMEGLLRSLLLQDYPAEIIFVDDRCDDTSPQMLQQFLVDTRTKGINDCRIITLTENPGPNHKQYALGRGIAESSGEFLLFTDGDCEVSPGWIRYMTKRMSDEKVGAAIGPVFKKKPGKGFFFLYQCYDHQIRYNYLAGAIGLGAAGGGFGNNLIIRRKALDLAGGYDAVPPSPTEDAALISQIRSQGKYCVRAVSLPDAAVETVAEYSWKALISQTLRWNNGGLFSPDPVTRFNYNLLMLLITTGVLAIPLLPFIPGLWPLSLGIYIVMIENTIAAFGLFRLKLPKGGLATGFGYFLAMLFTPIYFALMTLMGYCRIKIKWKEEPVL